MAQWLLRRTADSVVKANDSHLLAGAAANHSATTLAACDDHEIVEVQRVVTVIRVVIVEIERVVTVEIWEAIEAEKRELPQLQFLDIKS